MQKANTLTAANGRTIRTYEVEGVDTPATGLDEYWQWRFRVFAGSSPVVNLANPSPVEVVSVNYLSLGQINDFEIQASHLDPTLLPAAYKVFSTDIGSSRQTFQGLLLPEGVRLQLQNGGDAEAHILIVCRRVAATFVGVQEL